MKKILLIVLALTTVLGLVACTNTGNTVNSDTVATDTGSIQLAPADVVLFGGDDDYRIVYSSNATSAVKDMIVQMSSDIKAVTGENPKRVGDNAKNEFEQPKEILFAKTNRSASAESMSKISGIGYRVEFIGEKLVITASNDNAMKLAVEKLLATWTAADGKIILNNTTVLTEDMSENMLPICENGELKFKVIIQASAASEIHTAAESLAGRLSVLTGKTVSVEYDGMVKETEGAYEICIGNTNRAASKALYNSLETTYSYEVRIDGTRIVVGSKHNEALVSAISNLADDLCSAIASAYCGSPSIAKDYSIKGSSSNALLNFPEPKVGVSRGISKIGDDEYVFFYESIQKSDFETYVSSLKSAGCTENATYTMGGNEYALMENDSFSVYVAYLAKASSMRVVLNKPNTLQPDPAAPTEANVCKPALWQLEVDNKGSESNGGMSYVIQLTDGTFIVIDGGYNTNTEADNLYNLLKENTVGGGEPVISAWFITHLHSDHWGCLKNFSAKYGSTVTVKAFYYNFPGVGAGDITVATKNSIESYMKKFSGTKLYGKLHSGMSFSVVDAKISVICAYEDVYPLTIEEGNDTSTVFKVEVGGSSIMFLGDAYFNESATMVAQMDASALKSDIVQFSHHGYEGCSEGLYKLVNATTVLWPMNIVGYDSGNVTNVFKKWYNGSLSANQYVRRTMTIKKIIVSGAGTVKLDLPYTPTGSRLPDYDAIFKERTESDS